MAVRVVSHQNSEINVTPLVDVVLVLLIIFMVVTPLLEKDIGVQVPETETSNEPNPPPSGQVVATIGAGGEVSLNGNRVTVESFPDELRARFASGARRTLFVSASDAAPYSLLVSVLDGARRAGAETLAMTPGDDLDHTDH
jgi:biopolymer transport protein TolR